MEQPWQPLPAELALAPDDVHVFRADLDRPPAEVALWRQYLSADEQERADRFQFEQPRQRFIAGRGLLRILIGGYLRLPPAEVRFAYGEQGKPELDPALGQPEFHFNLAHSQSLALFAFARGRRLGIDVEFHRELVDAAGIAARFFSLQENAVLGRLSDDQKQIVFFDCWTRKEAFIKAIGEGLSHRLSRFDVALSPGRPARLLSIAGEAAPAAPWSMRALQPSPDHSAALAISGHDWRLTCWHWPD